jgi:FkbM family methyltransferase
MAAAPARHRLEVGSYFAAIAIALKRGVPIGSIIDLGCADGHFSVMARSLAPLAGAQILNVDAQAVYEPSLQRIQRALGGHYRIAAIADRPGTLTLTAGAHPYWSSLRPADDRYWAQHPGAVGAPVTVPAHRLDELVAELRLPGPHLLKLDVQGAEVAALAGAPRTLTDTNLVIVEVLLEDFAAIHRTLDTAGFELFDATELNRGGDHGLAWFYPVYSHRRLKLAGAGAFWSPDRLAEVIAVQERRRAAQLEELDAVLGPLEPRRPPGD